MGDGGWETLQSVTNNVQYSELLELSDLIGKLGQVVVSQREHMQRATLANLEEVMDNMLVSELSRQQTMDLLLTEVQ